MAWEGARHRVPVRRLGSVGDGAGGDRNRTGSDERRAHRCSNGSPARVAALGLSGSTRCDAGRRSHRDAGANCDRRLSRKRQARSPGRKLHDANRPAAVRLMAGRRRTNSSRAREHGKCRRAPRPVTIDVSGAPGLTREQAAAMVIGARRSSRPRACPAYRVPARVAYTARSNSSTTCFAPASRNGRTCVISTAATCFARSIQKKVL
jgi:hypothetical protein